MGSVVSVSLTKVPETERETWIRVTRAELDLVRQERAQVAERLSELDADTQALERSLCRFDPTAGQPVLDPAKKSVRAMCVEMAQANGGLLKTNEASHRMADAGLYPTSRAANKSMSTVLSRAKDFEKVGSGVWRYVGNELAGAVGK